MNYDGGSNPKVILTLLILVGNFMKNVLGGLKRNCEIAGKLITDQRLSRYVLASWPAVVCSNPNCKISFLLFLRIYSTKCTMVFKLTVSNSNNRSCFRSGTISVYSLKSKHDLPFSGGVGVGVGAIVNLLTDCAQ